MAGFKLNKEEKYLLRRLNQHPNANQSISKILSEGGFKFSPSSIELVFNNLIQADLIDGNPSKARITIYGRNYIDSNPDQFAEYEGDKHDDNHPKNLINQYKKYETFIKTAVREESIQTIINDTEYYFSKCIDKFSEFLSFKPAVSQSSELGDYVKEQESSFYLIALNDLESFYKFKDKRSNYGDFLAQLNNVSVKNLFTLIGELVAYVDFHAFNKNDWNEYADKRVLAKSQIKQPLWVEHFLRYKRYGRRVSYPPGIINALNVLESPIRNLNMLSERQRKLVSEVLMGVKYSKESFTSNVDNFFAPLNLKLANESNRLVVYTKILYRPSIRTIWDNGDPPEIELDSDDSDNLYDKTAFLHSDTLAEKDQLGRKQLTDEVVGLVEELFNKGEHKGAYTILLNGEWGAGKSSMLQFLDAKLRGDHGWRITKYNAWENQQFKDPWWILINAISKQASEEGFDGNIASHRAWKFGIQYRNKLWALFLIVVFLGSGLLFINSASENNFEFDFGVISGLLGLVGALTSAIVGLTNNFFFRNVSHEDLKERFADHPFKKIRDRFKEISEGNKLAVFIDDLDRCEPEPTVKLLEGIQTLFKDSQVLYVIAADAQWLIRCFDKHYEDFSSIAAPGHTIGEKFLEKSFQLKVTVPVPNDDIYDQYYNNLIGVVKKEEPIKPEVHKHQDEPQPEPTQVTTDTPEAESIAEPSETVTEREKVEKNLPKYLAEFKDAGVPRNPRQMKRFINQYIIMRATIKAEGRDFETLLEEQQEKAVRYLLFTMQFPKLSQFVKMNKLKINQIASGDFDKLKVEEDVSNCLQALTREDRNLLKTIFKTDENQLTFSDEELIQLQSV